MIIILVQNVQDPILMIDDTLLIQKRFNELSSEI